MFLAFAGLGFLVYSNTLDVPFHYDDPRVIFDRSFEEMLEKCKSGGSRVVAHLTFLFNYWLDGTNVRGYHVVNTLIHVGTAYLVYLFLSVILSVLNSKGFPSHTVDGSSHYAGHISLQSTYHVFRPALIGGVLFLVHPLATQAVTYITQRYTSLAGFFYIGSLTCFMRARLRFSEGEPFLTPRHIVPYIFSVAMAVLAMRTKELSITLPAAVLLAEYCFVKSDLEAASKRAFYLLPLLSTGLIIPLSDIIGVEEISLESMAAVQDYTWAEDVTRTEYLFTQFRIILGVYLKLLVWPIGQNIDHDYVVSRTLFDPHTMAALAVLCVILGTGLWLYTRAKLVSFGILWFFVTIAPTSSIVPNIQFVAEHRAYISLMGIAFAVAGMPLWEVRWKKYLFVIVPVLLTLSYLTYARNLVWRTDLALWKDAVAKSPNKPKPHFNLAVILDKQGRLDDAISHYRQALRLNPHNAYAHNNLGVALAEQGDFGAAIGHYYSALQNDPGHAEAHNNLAVALSAQGRLEEAISHYSRALRINPDYADAHNNLGVELSGQGRFNEAVSHYSRALHTHPDFAEAHQNMGLALHDIGKTEQAVGHYSRSLQIKPGNANAHFNMGNALAELGRLDEAADHLRQALRMKPDFPEARRNLELVLLRTDKSRRVAD